MPLEAPVTNTHSPFIFSPSLSQDALGLVGEPRQTAVRNHFNEEAHLELLSQQPGSSVRKPLRVLRVGLDLKQQSFQESMLCASRTAHQVHQVLAARPGNRADNVLDRR